MSTSSSSSSSSTPVSEIQTREREDRTENDISPVTVPTTVDERSRRPDIDQVKKIQNQKKRNPRGNGATRRLPTQVVQALKYPEWLQEFRENLVDDEIPEHGDSHASASHEVSLKPTFKRREDLGKHSVLLISLKTEIARSASGPKLQGLRAEDAMVEPYFVLKILVT